MNEQQLGRLREQFMGEVITPKSRDYEKRQNVFNQTGSPSAIARCQSAEDVVAAISFVRDSQVPFTVRSGGHNLNGLGTMMGGLVIDLTPLDTVEVLSAEQRIVRIGGGALWGNVAQELAQYGLAISSGDTKQVGVGGLTLGGGIGWMVRKYGLALDNLVAASIVLANGRIVRASNDENPDLFWAIRGGGGNFGVAVSFDFRAVPIANIVSTTAAYDVADTATLLQGWADYMRSAPEEISSIVEITGGGPNGAPPQFKVEACYAGDDEAAATEALQPLLELGAVQSKTIQKIPYASRLHDAPPKPPTFRLLTRGIFVNEVDSNLSALIAENSGKPGAPAFQIRSLGGAMARISPDATAFAHRSSGALIIVTVAKLPTMPDEQATAAAQGAWSLFSEYETGVYANFLTDTSEASVQAVYPSSTLSQLASAKAAYDPHNLFSSNLNIKPSQPAA